MPTFIMYVRACGLVSLCITAPDAEKAIDIAVHQVEQAVADVDGLINNKVEWELDDFEQISG